MADTYLNVFTNGVASYLSSCIFPAIMQGFAAKGVNTSVEELLAMTNTPATRTPATPVVPTPSVPAMAFGGPVPPMAPTVAPTNSRKTNAITTPVAGRTCMYQFKRGENKGKYCGKATAPGSDYCNACLKTRKNLSKEMAASAIPGTAPNMGAIPGMAGLPPGYTAPVTATPAQNTAPAQGGQLSVVPYDETRGLFREPNHNFIVYQVSPGVIAVIGRLSEAENKIVALTPQEQTTAQNIGLVLGEGAAATPTPVPTAVQAIPTAVPAIPTAVPPIPTAVPPIPTAVPAIPTVPAIPAAVPTTTPAPHVPAIPTAVIQANTLAGTGHPDLPVITPLTAPAQNPIIRNIPTIPQLTM
jgi:hypothetical protein